MDEKNNKVKPNPCRCVWVWDCIVKRKNGHVLVIIEQVFDVGHGLDG